MVKINRVSRLSSLWKFLILVNSALVASQCICSCLEAMTSRWLSVPASVRTTPMPWVIVTISPLELPVQYVPQVKIFLRDTKDVVNLDLKCSIYIGNLVWTWDFTRLALKRWGKVLMLCKVFIISSWILLSYSRKRD